MHFYWRVIEELKFLGETWVFSDPNISRCYKTWTEKNADAIALSLVEDQPYGAPLFIYKSITHSLN